MNPRPLLLFTAGALLATALHAQDVLDKGTSGVADDGTLMGSAVLDPTARYGANALRLPPGDGNYLQLMQPATDLDIPSGGYTYMCWFQQVASGQKGLIGLGNCCAAGGGGDNRNGYTMNITGSPTIRYWAGSTPDDNNYNCYSATQAAINDGMWHHAAIAVNEAPPSVTIYFDGVVSGSPCTAENIPTEVSRASPTALSNFVPKIGGDGISESSTADTLIDDVRIYSRALTAMEIADAMNNMGPLPELLYYDFEPGLVIDLVDAAATTVVRGQTGIPVAVTVRNASMTASFDSLAATVVFRDSGAVDVSGEYTVTPDPMNPTTLAPLAMAVLNFTVDVGLMPTTGTITLDATASANDTMTMTPVLAVGAAMTDTWDVLPPSVFVRTVDLADAEVYWCTPGYAVTVSVENTGIIGVDVTSVDLLLTDGGMADVTSEYVITPDPANPTTIAMGTTEVFGFTLESGAALTVDLIDLDAGFVGVDPGTMAPVLDPDADTPDSFVVHPCPSAALCGDCDANGVVSITDALLAAQVSAGLLMINACQFSTCNVIGLAEPDPGAVVDILDALSIAQASAGLPVMLVCC